MAGTFWKAGSYVQVKVVRAIELPTGLADQYEKIGVFPPAKCATVVDSDGGQHKITIEDNFIRDGDHLCIRVNIDHRPDSSFLCFRGQVIKNYTLEAEIVAAKQYMMNIQELVNVKRH